MPSVVTGDTDPDIIETGTAAETININQTGKEKNLRKGKHESNSDKKAMVKHIMEQHMIKGVNEVKEHSGKADSSTLNKSD